MRTALLASTFSVIALLTLCACNAVPADNGNAGRGAPTESNRHASQQPSPDTSSDPFATVPRVSVEELSKALKEGRAVVVDVRPIEAFEAERIRGALSIPEEEVKERAGELSPDKLVVTYCA
ncbi:MAG TPA: rhodanese-like domain-containing protein [Pyrinomonadaceae bacterium]